MIVAQNFYAESNTTQRRLLPKQNITMKGSVGRAGEGSPELINDIVDGLKAVDKAAMKASDAIEKVAGRSVKSGAEGVEKSVEAVDGFYRSTLGEEAADIATGLTMAPVAAIGFIGGAIKGLFK